MKQRIVSILVIVSFFCINPVFCADDEAVFFDTAHIEDSCAYEVYRNQYQDEMAKVQYLVNRVRYSDGTFIRNKQRYNGVNAGQWLDYKIDKLSHEFDTVEEFIEKVASYSRRSGKNYHMIIAEQSYPIKDVFFNELDRLYKYERELVQTKMNERLELQQNSKRAPELVSQTPISALPLSKTK
jgi:hypothetical protein